MDGFGIKRARVDAEWFFLCECGSEPNSRHWPGIYFAADLIVAIRPAVGNFSN
jgi:hypothetical protein